MAEEDQQEGGYQMREEEIEEVKRLAKDTEDRIKEIEEFKREH